MGLFYQNLMPSFKPQSCLLDNRDLHLSNTQSIRTGFAEVNGTTLYYEVAGAGHPFVLVHGHLLDRSSWDDQFAVFAKGARHEKGSQYTDITGGIIQAAEYLNETQAGRKTIVIFSDMQEELDYKTVRDIPIKLDGIRIVALNVTKLGTDNVDPRRYLDRLEWWEKRARGAGAVDWKVVNDMEHLDRIFRKSS